MLASITNYTGWVTMQAILCTHTHSLCGLPLCIILCCMVLCTTPIVLYYHTLSRLYHSVCSCLMLYLDITHYALFAVCCALCQCTIYSAYILYCGKVQNLCCVHHCIYYTILLCTLLTYIINYCTIYYVHVAVSCRSLLITCVYFCTLR